MAETNLFDPLLTAMLEVATAALDPRPSRSIISPGPPAWDDCCAGQVWVRLINLVPGSGIAGGMYRGTQQYPCGVLNWQATIGVGIIRCAHTVDDQGKAPSAALVTEDARSVLTDMVDLSMAIQCEMAVIANVEKLTMVRWDTLGPDGGCVGGEWVFTTFVDNCRC